MKKIIAITGKIGAGKSTLIYNLEKAFSVFSVDKIQKKLYQPEGKLWKMVKNEFPNFIIKNNVVSKLIKEKLIQDSDFKNQYQEKVIDILIPEIESLTKNLTGLIFVEIPYINSMKLSRIFDFIVIVEANKNTRLKRIMSRDSLSKEEAQKWINSYVENISFNKSIIIENNSTINDLEKQLTEVFKCIIL